jgi:GNAT superfamily N-acetyltransferase
VCRRAQAAEDEPGEPILTDPEFEHDARRQWPLYDNRRVVAWHGGAIVGIAGFWFRREDAPDYGAYAPFVQVWGGVRQPWRRRGIATALLRPVLAFMQERGKTIATLGTHLPAGRAFLAAIGAAEKHRSIVNRVTLAELDWDELGRWQAAAAPPGSGLHWEVHAGRVPKERFAALCPEFTALLRDVPMGSLDLPPLRYEMPGYLARYQEMERRGGAHHLVLLMDGDAVAGMCEATWSARFPDRVFQDLTAVARPWRGRGLAKGLKAAMLRLVREHQPEARLLSTVNSAENAAILAINRRLGYVVHRAESSYQIGEATLRGYLAMRR